MVPRLVSVAAAGVLTLASAATAYAAPPAVQTLVVRTDDELGVPAEVLARAREQAGHVYAAVGVRIVWVDRDEADADARLPDLDVRLISESGFGREFATEVLGAAPRSATEYRTAYVFYDRVDKLTDSHRSDPADLLAFVMAHELGHLLLPIGSHTRAGLMRGQWLLRDVEPTKNILLQFSDTEAALIRARASMLAGTRNPGRDSHATP